MAAGYDAVAIAQAMSIFGKPTSLNGYTFDWTAMCAPEMTDDAVTQIARLMALIGEYVDFDYLTYYDDEITNAEIEGIIEAMRACGYENAVGTLGQDNGTATPYPYSMTTVRNELEASHPVIARGKKIGKNEPWRAWLLHGFMARQREVEKRRETATGIEILSRSTETQNTCFATGEYVGGVTDTILAVHSLLISRIHSRKEAAPPVQAITPANRA